MNVAGVDMPKSLSNSKKKKVCDKALSWLRRGNQVNIDGITTADLEALAGIAGIPMSRAKLTTKDKKLVVDSTLLWVRNNNIRPDQAVDISLLALTLLAGVSMHQTLLNPLADIIVHKLGKLTGALLPCKRLAPQEKKDIISDAVNWIRSNEVNPKDLSDHRCIIYLHTAFQVIYWLRKSCFCFAVSCYGWKESIFLHNQS